MDLLQLNYFRVVARSEHMTKAAEKLFIAQPSLSKTIRRLEKEVGVPLFDRQGRGIRLNQFGEAFLKHVETIFRELEAAQSEVRDMAGLEQGSISLVAPSLYPLPGLLHAFKRLHPGVHFHLSQRPLAEIPQQLEKDGCDFCFLSTPLIKPGIQWQPLITGDVVLVVPPEHRLAGQVSVSLSEIADETVVIEKVGSGLRDFIDAYCQEAGFTLRVMCEIDEPGTLLNFIKARLGIGFAPALMKWQIHEQKLVPIGITDPILRRTFGIAWHQERYMSQAAQAFLDFVVRYYADIAQKISD